MQTRNQSMSPFAGYPRTIVEENCSDGTVLKHTTLPRFQGPWLAKISDVTTWLATLAAGSGSLFASIEYELHGWLLAASVTAASTATFAAGHFGLRHVIARTSRVVFTPDQFIHFGFFRAKTFDRSLPHSFALFTHRKADREEQKLSFKERRSSGKWWARSPKRYYGNSYHIAFQYMGQRHDLMTVYRHEVASKILARLKANDEAVEAKVGGGRGQALNPQDEWADQSGALASFATPGDEA